MLFALGISFTSCTKDFEDGLNYNNGNQEAGNGNGNNPAGTGVFKAVICASREIEIRNALGKRGEPYPTAGVK